MSVQYVTPMLAQFDTNIALITNEAANPQGGGFKPSGYRFTADQEPDSAAEGLYYLDVPRVAPKSRFFGTGENIWKGSVKVQLGYFRGGGNAGGVNGGDRRSVSVRANDDCMRLSDTCENPLNYNSASTGIMVIQYTGHYRAFNLKKYEIWEVDFDVTWRSDLATTNTISSTLGPDVSVFTIAGEFKSTDTIGDEDVATQAVFFNFDDVAWINVAARLMGRTKVTGGMGTYNLRMGGTPGLPDGTVIATGTATGLSYVVANLAGNPFVNPKGEQLIQVTFKNDTVGQSSYVRDISISLRAA